MIAGDAGSNLHKRQSERQRFDAEGELPEGVEERVSYEAGERYDTFTLTYTPRAEVEGKAVVIHRADGQAPDIKNFPTENLAREYAIATVEAWLAALATTSAH